MISGQNPWDASYTVVDVETTGLDYATGDRICEFAAYSPARLGWMRNGPNASFLVNPGKPISPVISAITHLTDADVRFAIREPDAQEAIAAFIPLGSMTVVVAHNAAFDRSFLPSLAGLRWLCTKRLAQHVVPEAPGFSNQVLRYYFGGHDLDLQGQAPHRAMADCIVTSFNLAHLLARVIEQHGLISTDAIIALADSPIEYTNWPLGKYRNKPITTDLGYVKWMLANNKDLDADLRWSLEKVLA